MHHNVLYGALTFPCLTIGLLHLGGRDRLVFWFASDIDHYVGWTLARIVRAPGFIWPADHADAWRTPYEGWPGTRYEAKAKREGRTPSYLRFKRI